MISGFWSKLKKPAFLLAPMANVTDAAFRRIISKYGKPDAMWTEFVSVDGLMSAGREKLLPDLWFTAAERPIVAQIFGARPELYPPVIELLQELGFDGVDINMGCPDRGVEKQGAGAALIKNPKLAAEIVRVSQEAAGEMPVSVKTRLGYNKVEIKEWLPRLLETGLAAITVHLRTRKEMSDVPARWELGAEIVALRDKYAPDTLVFGNGDAASLAEARRRAAETGLDGVMVGRGIFGNPWFFSLAGQAGYEPDTAEKLRVMAEHTELFEKLYKSNTAGRLKNFDIMKKHYKAYAAGFDGAKELRMRLMEAKDAAQVRALTEEFIGGL